jgi:hypothetical protein
LHGRQIKVRNIQHVLIETLNFQYLFWTSCSSIEPNHHSVLNRFHQRGPMSLGWSSVHHAEHSIRTMLTLIDHTGHRISHRMGAMGEFCSFCITYILLYVPFLLPSLCPFRRVPRFRRPTRYRPYYWSIGGFMKRDAKAIVRCAE